MTISNVNNPSDTICAIATPPGIGGIAVIRISGPDSINIADKLWKGLPLSKVDSHTAHLGQIINPDTEQTLDQAVATVFHSPRSYTGDTTVELSIHGSIYLQNLILKLLIDNGCRLAEPGEYTRRAFIAGNIDLAQAEAVADIIQSSSAASHRLAINQMRGQLSKALTELRNKLLHLSSLIELELDFSEEDVTFASRDELTDITNQSVRILSELIDSYADAQAIRNGLKLTIVGQPNAGKSTLLNTLANDDRAIVSPIPGTTRDTIEDSISINGQTYRITDTAGIRSTTDDTIEAIGIKKSIKSIMSSDIILWLIDPTDNNYLPETAITILREINNHNRLIIAINKSDITPDINSTIHKIKALSLSPDTKIITIAANSRQTITPLIEILKQLAPQTPDAVFTNARHYSAAASALASLKALSHALQTDSERKSPPHLLDTLSLDLRDAIHHIGEITGEITTPDILNSIFSSFCIGK